MLSFLLQKKHNVLLKRFKNRIRIKIGGGSGGIGNVNLHLYRYSCTALDRDTVICYTMSLVLGNFIIWVSYAIIIGVLSISLRALTFTVQFHTFISHQETIIIIPIPVSIDILVSICRSIIITIISIQNEMIVFIIMCIYTYTAVGVLQVK